VAELWIRRLGTQKSGFRYERPDGGPVRDRKTLARIDTLRVPPAWRGVHVSPEARRLIQAWGFDARGRKQYRYHERAVAKRDLRKYHRVRQLAKKLPRIRRALRVQSHHPKLNSDTASAIALRLISESLLRPGSERSLRENRSYGMTTLRKRHVALRDKRAVFTFIGKSSKPHRQVLANADLLPLIKRLQRTPGQRLFQYRDGTGWSDLSASMLIGYLRTKIGPFSVKDFRTWGGTLRAATVLAELGPPLSPSEAKRNVALAMRIVSSELGNTPAICRASYVHPMLLARYLDDGETIAIRHHGGRKQGTAFARSPEERALIAFLDKHFPERRRRPREAMAGAA